MSSFNTVITLLLCLTCYTVAYTSTGNCGPTTITYYDYNNAGSCSYGATGGSLMKSSNIVAASKYFFNGSYACGECFLMTGSKGSQVMMVADLCPGGDWCSSTNTHFDIAGRSTFDLIEDSNLGHAQITSQRVACPLSGNVGIYTKDGVSAYWMAVLVYNHAVGIARVEIQPSSSSAYYDMIRQDYNYWIYDKMQLSSPFNVRITSKFGDKITISVTDFTPQKSWTASSQFPVPSNTYSGCSSSPTSTPTSPTSAPTSPTSAPTSPTSSPTSPTSSPASPTSSPNTIGTLYSFENSIQNWQAGQPPNYAGSASQTGLYQNSNHATAGSYSLRVAFDMTSSTTQAVYYVEGLNLDLSQSQYITFDIFKNGQPPSVTIALTTGSNYVWFQAQAKTISDGANTVSFDMTANIWNSNVPVANRNSVYRIAIILLPTATGFNEAFIDNIRTSGGASSTNSPQPTATVKATASPTVKATVKPTSSSSHNSSSSESESTTTNKGSTSNNSTIITSGTTGSEIPAYLISSGVAISVEIWAVFILVVICAFN